MNAEKLQLTLDANEAPGLYISEISTVVCSGDFPSRKWGVPIQIGAGMGAAGTVDIGGTVFVYSEPTAEWYSIYPKVGPTIDILEDLDVPFRPKKTRIVKGVVVQRERARFKTAFTDELVDDVDTD